MGLGKYLLPISMGLQFCCLSGWIGFTKKLDFAVPFEHSVFSFLRDKLVECCFGFSCVTVAFSVLVFFFSLLLRFQQACLFFVVFFGLNSSRQAVCLVQFGFHKDDTRKEVYSGLARHFMVKKEIGSGLWCSLGVLFNYLLGVTSQEV